MTALALTSASVAVAAPAVVTRNATARSAPFDVAPASGSLRAGDKVEADESATNGWRRVMLPGGKYGYVRDGDLQVELSRATPTPTAVPTPASADATAAPVEPLVPASPSTSTSTPPQTAKKAARAPVYVEDFAHLATLVKSDPQVLGPAEVLVTRQTASSVAIWGGVLGGVLLRVLGRTALQNKTCLDTFTGAQYCAESDNQRVLDLGLDLIVLGPLLGWAIRPTHDDKIAVINAWNANHPNHPMLDGAGVVGPLVEAP